MTKQIEFLERCKAVNLHSGSLFDWLVRVETLQAENAALKEQVAQLKTVPMKYRRMAFNAQLQDENAELSKQLASLQSKSAALADALETCKSSTRFDLQEEPITTFYFDHKKVIDALAAFKGM